jgi:CelD/BcsL family acetyltransferase involved in cellulose biosynthesis
MAIDISAGKEAYFNGLPKKLRKDIRQKKRRAIKDYGDISIKAIKGENGTARYYDMYMEMTVKAFRERGRRNMLEDKAYAGFFREFLMAADKRGMSDAFAFYAGDKLLAIIFGYKIGPGYNWALTGFDYEFRYVRPGYLLVEGIIDEMVRRGDTICNCYGHESFFKNQWCNKMTPMYRFYIAKKSVRGSAFMAAQKAAGIMRSNKIIAATAKKLKKA